jgi:D-alanine--poly(phosphoribitol) ligase subunit 1
VAAVFAEVAARQTEAVAIRWTADQHTTYGHLDAVANRIARVLLHRGLRKRDVVCLASDKCLPIYAAMLACLKLGAPYVAVDPGNPRARIQSIIERCRPKLALAHPAVASVFPCDTLPVDSESREQSWLTGVDDCPVDLPWSIDGSDPAYVMFTSGSTGTPKGATMSHANLLNFMAWVRHEFGVGPGDVVTNLNPLFFDNSVFDVYASLFTGASLVPFTTASLREPEAILARIAQLGCTVYFSVPSLLVYFQRLKLVAPESFPSLRILVFGGEGYPKPMLVKLYETLGHRIAMYNVYGPTECTCICSTYRISAIDFADLNGYPPLGALIPNFSHAILDPDGHPVALGEIGELYLGGPCVGLGYYRAPAETAAAFVQNPTHERFFDRVYKTGDLVRYEPADGKLHFVGRTDTQIKHQGYRIELGEIEHALGAIDGVGEAVAIHNTAGGTSRIIAVLATSATLVAPQVKQFLAQRLPRYMIPDRVIVVSELLKNANGKIDRNGISAAIARGDL